ncbi:MAG: hypothetical protein Q7J61_04265 [Deltaproteobacteria bacterium]|nr:hypothetical protein [Deltaproteobacteria bacterium]
MLLIPSLGQSRDILGHFWILSEQFHIVAREEETMDETLDFNLSPGKLAPFDSAQGALSLPNGHNMTKPRIQEIG